jgi:site-specific recombinase XerD
MIVSTSQKRIRLPGKLIAEYSTFLQDHQCLAPSTIAARRNRVAAFLDFLKDQAAPSKIRNITSSMVHDYIIGSAKSLSRGSRKLLFASIRSFLRFLHFRGYSNRNLVPAVPVIRAPKLASVPRYIHWDWVKKLLSAPDKRTRRGRRNYAILQLLATYGVRIGQALSLRISDIKWEEELIYFQSSKRGKSLCFPLQKDVAQALLDYIRKDRRNASFPQLFLTVKGHHQRPLSCNISLKPLLKSCHKLDVSKLKLSWHSIRHAFATRLMEQEVPIKTIADLLGHRCIDTTFIYTKVDLPHLRLLAREWPEVHP